MDALQAANIFLSEYPDLAALVCSKYHATYSCWRYEPVHRRLIVDLGQLWNWDYNEQDAQSLAIFQHIHLGLVDVLVIRTYIERTFRHDNGKRVSFDDVVECKEFKDLFSLIEFDKIKKVIYTSSPIDYELPYPPWERGVRGDINYIGVDVNSSIVDERVSIKKKSEKRYRRQFFYKVEGLFIPIRFPLELLKIFDVISQSSIILV